MAAMEENEQEPWDATKKEKVNKLATMMMDATSKDYIDQDLMGQIQSLTEEVQQFYPLMNPDKVQVQTLKEYEAKQSDPLTRDEWCSMEKFALKKHLKSMNREVSKIQEHLGNGNKTLTAQSFTVHFSDGEEQYFKVFDGDDAGALFDKTVIAYANEHFTPSIIAEDLRKLNGIIELFATFNQEVHVIELDDGADDKQQYGIYRTKTKHEKISAKNITLFNSINNDNREDV